MTRDDVPNLGSLTMATERDAVHIAVVPVVSRHVLSPGEHVGVVEGQAARMKNGTGNVGVVDPYLKDPVEPGERFWLFLYPGTIRSLRHEWAHPAFPLKERLDPDGWKERAASEKWLRENVVDRECTYEKLLAAAESGDFYLTFGSETRQCEVEERAGELWFHLETVTGKRIRLEDRQSYFRCLC